VPLAVLPEDLTIGVALRRFSNDGLDDTWHRRFGATDDRDRMSAWKCQWTRNRVVLRLWHTMRAVWA